MAYLERLVQHAAGFGEVSSQKEHRPKIRQVQGYDVLLAQFTIGCQRLAKLGGRSIQVSQDRHLSGHVVKLYPGVRVVIDFPIGNQSLLVASFRSRMVALKRKQIGQFAQRAGAGSFLSAATVSRASFALPPRSCVVASSKPYSRLSGNELNNVR